MSLSRIPSLNGKQSPAKLNSPLYTGQMLFNPKLALYKYKKGATLYYITHLLNNFIENESYKP